MASIFPVRPSTRRQGASVSYKEDSADETGSEDLVEVNWENNEGATAAEPDNAETIERIIDTRFGRKGGILCPNTILEQVMNDYSNRLATGPTTTVYAVEENSYPNKQQYSRQDQFLPIDLHIFSQTQSQCQYIVVSRFRILHRLQPRRFLIEPAAAAATTAAAAAAAAGLSR